MKNVSSYIFVPVFLLSVLASWLIWKNSPEYIKQGGPLLILGLTSLFLVVTYGIERTLVLWRAGGRSGAHAFVATLKKSLAAGDVAGALAASKIQGGTIGNVIGAGLSTWQSLVGGGVDRKEMLAETRRAIEEASALETPILERNLNALSTIASIATLLGLLGTTIGMIRAFRAMSHAGSPDAVQLALGISEALVNTALGLITAIIGIVLHNYFTTRVENIGSNMEEAAFEVLSILRERKDS
ncbi:MAG: MotA/TolQ/ExbB proton channel family protein [Candidatus Eisenbacteria bacterium]|nr:MotA/TolQ/ExbB proton channel family protein [Candidatus Eisenbacteria bacterium]